MNAKEIDNPLSSKLTGSVEPRLMYRWKVDYNLIKGLALKRTGSSLRAYFKGEMGLSDTPELSDEIFNSRFNSIKGNCNAENLIALDRKMTLIQYAYADRLTKQKFERLLDLFTKTSKERNIITKRGIPKYMDLFLGEYKDKPVVGARLVLKAELDSIFFNAVLEIVGRDAKVAEKKIAKNSILGSAFEQFGISSDTPSNKLGSGSLDDMFSKLSEQSSTDSENSIDTSEVVKGGTKIIGDGDSKSQEIEVREVKSDKTIENEIETKILEICKILGIKNSDTDFVKKLCNESLSELLNIKNNINAYSNATIKSVLEDFFTSLMYCGVTPEEGYSVGDTINIEEEDLCKSYKVTSPIDKSTKKGTIKYSGWCYNGELISPKTIEPNK